MIVMLVKQFVNYLIYLIVLFTQIIILSTRISSTLVNTRLLKVHSSNTGKSKHDNVVHLENVLSPISKTWRNNISLKQTDWQLRKLSQPIWIEWRSDNAIYIVNKNRIHCNNTDFTLQRQLLPIVIFDNWSNFSIRNSFNLLKQESLNCRFKRLGRSIHYLSYFHLSTWQNKSGS